MIQINNVTRQYDTVCALKDINLSIHKDRTILFGPSGSGKTTLLRIIASLETPSSGNVQFTKNESISMVFQKDYLFNHLTVFENIAYGLNHHDFNKDEIKSRVEWIVQVCHIDFSLSQKTSTLSGGQRQRVSLARALISKPDLLLMDEPFSQLDLQLKIELMDELIKILEENHIQLIYVTHDIEEAKKIGEEFIFIRNGHIEKIAECFD
ncbi:MAG: ATP-binding cassette domain-containing protein [Holdemanella sp.]|nr:ATP-binding cassette domain-containing protein [Holdemanella sp.]